MENQTEVIRTKDGQAVEVGTEIYYTGDMANSDGIFRVDKIYSSRFYPVMVDLVELNVAEGAREFKGLTPASFEPGPGTRFITMAKHEADRRLKIQRFKERMETLKTPPSTPSQFELLKTLEWNQPYTLSKYGEFGFLWAIKLNLLEVRIEPYAQYPQSVVLVGRPHGKRKVYGYRILPYERFIVWRGFQNVRTSMWVEQEKSPTANIKKSLLSFDGEYMRMAIDSVPETPLIAKTEYGEK